MGGPYQVDVLDAETGETITRELTAEEIAALPEATNDLAEPV